MRRVCLTLIFAIAWAASSANAQLDAIRTSEHPSAFQTPYRTTLGIAPSGHVGSDLWVHDGSDTDQDILDRTAGIQGLLDAVVDNTAGGGTVEIGHGQWQINGIDVGANTLLQGHGRNTTWVLRNSAYSTDPSTTKALIVTKALNTDAPNYSTGPVYQATNAGWTDHYVMNFAIDGSPTLSRWDLTEDTAYRWTPSSIDATEFFVELAAGGDPGLSEPPGIIINGADATEGSLGSLEVGEWAYGDSSAENGFDTIYVRITGDADPDGEADDYVGTYFWEFASTEEGGVAFGATERNGVYDNMQMTFGSSTDFTANPYYMVQTDATNRRAAVAETPDGTPLPILDVTGVTIATNPPNDMPTQLGFRNMGFYGQTGEDELQAEDNYDDVYECGGLFLHGKGMVVQDCAFWGFPGTALQLERGLHTSDGSISPKNMAIEHFLINLYFGSSLRGLHMRRGGDSKLRNIMAYNCRDEGIFFEDAGSVQILGCHSYGHSHCFRMDGNTGPHFLRGTTQVAEGRCYGLWNRTANRTKVAYLEAYNIGAGGGSPFSAQTGTADSSMSEVTSDGGDLMLTLGSGHGFLNNDPVLITTSSARPTGVNADRYFVQERTNTTIKLSTSTSRPNGTAPALVAFSDAGTGIQTVTLFPCHAQLDATTWIGDAYIHNQQTASNPCVWMQAAASTFKGNIRLNSAACDGIVVANKLMKVDVDVEVTTGDGTENTLLYFGQYSGLQNCDIKVHMLTEGLVDGGTGEGTAHVDFNNLGNGGHRIQVTGAPVTVNFNASYASVVAGGSAGGNQLEFGPNVTVNYGVGTITPPWQ